MALRLKLIALSGVVLLAACGGDMSAGARESGWRADPAGFSAGGLQANSDVWEKYKRIRQGKSAGPQEEARAKPAAAKPASQPATPPAATPVTQPEVVARPAPPPPRPAASVKLSPARDKRFQVRASSAPVSAPGEPTDGGSWWAFYRGTLAVAEMPLYGPYGIDFQWAYSLRRPLPDNPRILVSMHGSGAGNGAMWPYGPSSLGDIEVRTQDAETYGQHLREWWTFDPRGVPAPGRRIAATLHYMEENFDFDPDSRGIVLEGPSMGGAGAVIQTMILPDPWRARIAWVSARAGVVMPRRVYAKHPGQYRKFPSDGGRKSWLWDRIDFAVQAAVDPIVRGIHYRHAFGSNDQFSDGPDGSTLLEFVNLVEQNKIGGAFSWGRGGHGTSEAGLNIPELWKFEVPEQDVTLDRAHPAITQSTGNYPLTLADRVDEENFPRGHYNLGIVWDHARIVDTREQIIFPLKYGHRTGFGKGVPDQPRKITVNVTPRRPRNFAIVDGETLRWSWDGGALSGTAQVVGDTVTIEGVPLVSGQRYKNLRIFR